MGSCAEGKNEPTLDAQDISHTTLSVASCIHSMYHSGSPEQKTSSITDVSQAPALQPPAAKTLGSSVLQDGEELRPQFRESYSYASLSATREMHGEENAECIEPSQTSRCYRG